MIGVIPLSGLRHEPRTKSAVKLHFYNFNTFKFCNKSFHF